MIQNHKTGRWSPDWKVFDDWDLLGQSHPVRHDWNAVDDMLSAFTGVFADVYSQLHELLGDWDRLLAEFGGDPTHKNWRRFRLLRTWREEDWSDWLAYLIESSESGVFACMLFGDAVVNRRNYATPKSAEREVAHTGFRADVVVEWTNQIFTHIEVKVGDSNLAKTLPTGRVMRKRYHQPEERWNNCILLLSRQLPHWEATDQAEAGEPPVKVITWESVCIALRRGLQSEESIRWKVFAYTMIGAVEQLLVGYPGYRLDDRPIENIDAKLHILQQGLMRAHE